MNKPTSAGKGHWQLVDGDAWINVTDKLIGVEITIHGRSGENSGSHPAWFVIPPEHVGSLVKKLMQFGIEGNVSIAREESTNDR